MDEGEAAPALREDELIAIARLAHINLAPDEIKSLTRDVGRILAYVRTLEELDVERIPPTAHVQIERLPLRPDELSPEVRPSLPRELALAEAPAVEQDGFAVPAFVDEG
jgi:aspartyl-tRNA(Asn)/glutamyl-tRNA(Gln) amidotransferase subunit C